MCQNWSQNLLTLIWIYSLDYESYDQIKSNLNLLEHFSNYLNNIYIFLSMCKEIIYLEYFYSLKRVLMGQSHMKCPQRLSFLEWHRGTPLNKEQSRITLGQNGLNPSLNHLILPYFGQLSDGLDVFVGTKPPYIELSLPVSRRPRYNTYQWACAKPLSISNLALVPRRMTLIIRMLEHRNLTQKENLKLGERRFSGAIGFYNKFLVQDLVVVLPFICKADHNLSTMTLYLYMHFNSIMYDFGYQKRL